MSKKAASNFDIQDLIRAYIPAFFVGTMELDRATKTLILQGKALGMDVYIFDPGEGLSKKGKNWVSSDPLAVLEQIIHTHIRNPYSGKPILWILQLFHLFLRDPDPLILSKLRTINDQPQYNATVVLLVDPPFQPPTELEDMLYVNFPLPDKACLEKLVASDMEDYTADELHEIVQLLLGFSYKEAESILSISITQNGRFEKQLIRDFKAQVIKTRAGNLLEFPGTDAGMADVGGMQGLLSWLRVRESAFLSPARLEAYRLPQPRGIFLLGLPGCGKTLTARAIAGSWGIPLLKLNAGRLYTAEVGGSEQRLFQAIAVARAMAPCVLLVDEIEKGFASVSSFSDGGVALRIQAALLDFLQERHDRIFVVATSNGLAELSPELLRRGRWDEIFFADLPDEDERRHIFQVLFQRYQVPVPVDPDCVRAAADFSGAEIEQAIRDTLYTECIYAERPFSTLALFRQIKTLVPLSHLKQKEIETMRAWAARKARPANGA